jgi:hypothetical protein
LYALSSNPLISQATAPQEFALQLWGEKKRGQTLVLIDILGIDGMLVAVKGHVKLNNAEDASGLASQYPR